MEQQNFISMAYRQHRVMPISKTLGKAVYKLTAAIKPRVEALAGQFGFDFQDSDGCLVIWFY